MFFLIVHEPVSEKYRRISFQNLYTFQLRVNRAPELQTETGLAKILVGKVREQS